MNDYAQKKQLLAKEMQAGASGLYKSTSNLFRDRHRTPARRLDVRDFNHVIAVDPVQGWVDAEGMTSYADLVAATLPHGVMPTVVPQLRSITLGGAVSGVGIESSSFKYGLVHETVHELDVLTGDGRVLTCTPTNDYRDLFYGFPNAYGTLGYALRLRVQTVPVKPYVKLSYRRHHDAPAFFADLDQSRATADFLDGVVFAPDELYLCIGEFVDEAPYTSDYTYQHIYYRSLRERATDYLTIHDYLWRWDTDWFWCSKNLYAQHPLIRRLYGRKRLNSVTYTQLMRLNSRLGLSRRLERWLGYHSEAVIQDVDIPLAQAAAFLDFFHRDIGIKPIWVCPIHPYDPAARFPLYPLDPHTVTINFGFWDVIRSRAPRPPGYYNRKVENKVAELGGIKSLYSDAYYSEDEFWRYYDRATYTALKDTYDAQHRFPDLYHKTVLRG